MIFSFQKQLICTLCGYSLYWPQNKTLAVHSKHQVLPHEFLIIFYKMAKYFLYNNLIELFTRCQKYSIITLLMRFTGKNSNLHTLACSKVPPDSSRVLNSCRVLSCGAENSADHVHSLLFSVQLVEYWCCTKDLRNKTNKQRPTSTRNGRIISPPHTLHGCTHATAAEDMRHIPVTKPMKWFGIEQVVMCWVGRSGAWI